MASSGSLSEDEAASSSEEEDDDDSLPALEDEEEEEEEDEPIGLLSECPCEGEGVLGALRSLARTAASTTQAGAPRLRHATI